jgi:hypothetical protein
VTNGVVEMDLQELHKALTSPGSTLGLDLSAGALKSESISRLVNDFFGGAFHVAGIEKKPEASEYQGRDAIRVSGRLALPSMFLGRSGWAVDGSFFIDDGRAEVVLTLAADQWLIADGVELHDCVFTLDSRSSPPLGKDFDELFDNGPDTSDPNARKRGLQLAADVVLSRIDRTLSDVLDFGSDSRLRVIGPAELIGDMPASAVRGAERGGTPAWRMQLGAQVGSPLQFGQLNAQLTYEFLVAPNVKVSIRERLTATLTYEHNNKVVKIPLSATFKPNAIEDGVTIAGKPIVTKRDEPNREAGLSLWDLGGLIPGDLAGISQPLDSFPELKSALSVVQLSDFCAIVRPDPLRITAAYARLQVQLQWEIIKDLISFEEAALEIFVTRGDDGWDLRPYLTADLAVAGGMLSVRVDPLGRSFNCVLATGSKIDATKLLAIDILHGLPSSPLSETKDKFEITWFEITGDPVAKSYSLDIVTDFDWRFDLGAATRLAIKQISLSLEYTKERFSEGSVSEYPNEQLFFELRGSLAIGDATISVGAKYDSAHWTVSGAAYDIRLNEILNLLPNVEQLKSVLPEIELPFVELEVTPSTGAFKFDAVCEINWSSRPLGIDGQFSGDIALHLARAPGSPLTYDILFRGTGQLADPALAATLNVQIQKADENEQLVMFGGTLAIKNEDVTLDTDLTFKGNVVVGADEKTIILAFKPEKNLAVTDVLGKLLPGDLPAPSIGIGLKDALFAYRKSAVVGATLKLDLSLGKMLPEALKALLGEPEIGVDNLRVLYTTTTLAKADLENLNAHIAALALAPLPSVADPDTKQVELREGFQASGSLKFGGQKPTPLMLPMAAPKLDGAGPASVPAASKTEPKPETSEAKWIDIGKSLGPLRIGRVGGQYSSGKIGLLLDAAVDLAGLHIGLSGFALHIPLRQGEVPSIGLDGLDLAYAGGPIEVAGALLRRHVEGQPDSYDGLALIKAPTFSIAGMGSITTVEREVSVFIFAALQAELGGPPAFRLQGIAGGFGYNRRLILPPIESVHAFPLVRAAIDASFLKSLGAGAGAGAGKGAQTPAQTALKHLANYIPPMLGEYWLAAGIKFNSFEMITAVALVSVSFGHDVEIGLLGLAQMSLPRGAPKDQELAYVELALRCSIKPAEGTVIVEGRLTDASYILSKDCRLTGGFAFCFWFSGEHKGDFVVTLGGYHPAFARPKHYPLVPRLGVQWQITNELSVAAELYFALTPSCIMAGGRLAAIYSSSSVRAWFIVSTDFLIAWQPLRYSVTASLGIGFEVDVGGSALRIYLQAELRLWGPPFAGQLHVDLGVAAVTIDFGETYQAPKPLTADQFKKAFLPEQSDVVTARVESGLLLQDTREGQPPLFVVSAHALKLSVESTVPLTGLDFVKNRVPQKNGVPEPLPSATLGVSPMAKTALHAPLKLSIIQAGEPISLPSARCEFVETGTPEALWRPAKEEGQLLQTKASAETMRATTGVRLALDPIPPVGASAIIRIDKEEYDDFKKLIPALERVDALPSTSKAGVEQTMTKPTSDQRDEILRVLRQRWPSLQASDLTETAKRHEECFRAEPKPWRLGELEAR